MDAAAEVYEKTGLRGRLSYSTMDEVGLPESIAGNAKQAVAETDRLYSAWDGKGNLKVYYSLRALNSCSDELTEPAATHAKERSAVLQAHMNEYQGEVDGILNREGMRPYEYLEKMGVLSSKFLGAHSLLLSEKEKELVEQYGVRLCHCPFSNCGKAVPDTPDLVSRGIIPGFGSDGAAAIDEEESCGRIEVGYQVDLIGIELSAGRLIPSGNLLHTMFECAESGDVRDVIVGGKVLMQDREVKVLDEEQIRFKATEYMKKEGVL